MRRPLRLPYHTYEEGCYFITTCTHEMRGVFGRVEVAAVILNQLGALVARQLAELPMRIDGVAMDEYVVMPNHVHAVVQLSSRARQASPLRLGHVVSLFKSGSAREINALRVTPGAKVWQRGYHDHIIRDEADLERLREYVTTNPGRWAEIRNSP